MQRGRPPPAVWRTPTFVGLLCDPFVDGTGLSRGQHPSMTMKALNEMLMALISSPPRDLPVPGAVQPTASVATPTQPSGSPDSSSTAVTPQGVSVAVAAAAPPEQRPSERPLFSPINLTILGEVREMLASCGEYTSALASCTKPEQIANFITILRRKITALGVGQMLLVPGGWNGLTSTSWLTHIVERTSPTQT
ncbi:hypothetical protein Pelo_12150 [Pelomyxa schiedti]|nr:hypothetical protein Pelo_12150 [Pelomyxa schiedti]